MSPALVAPLEVLVEPCYLNSPSNLGWVAKKMAKTLGTNGERIISTKYNITNGIYRYYVYRV